MRYHVNQHLYSQHYDWEKSLLPSIRQDWFSSHYLWLSVLIKIRRKSIVSRSETLGSMFFSSYQGITSGGGTVVGITVWVHWVIPQDILGLFMGRIQGEMGMREGSPCLHFYFIFSLIPSIWKASVCSLYVGTFTVLICLLIYVFF